MRVYSSLWNADNWATRGGLVKIDWTSAPFTARFQNFRARACKWNGDISISQCGTTSPANWWTSPIYSQLSSAKRGQLQWVRDNFMIYDYCKDTKRFNGQIPPECFIQQFWFEATKSSYIKRPESRFYQMNDSAALTSFLLPVHNWNNFLLVFCVWAFWLCFILL